MVISGAIIGQDTVNGNRSKDESAKGVLWDLVQSDMAMLEDWWSNIVLPSYAANGILKPGLYFEFSQSEDADQLFKFTTGLLPFKNVEDAWLKEKFGVEVTGDRSVLAGDNQLKYGEDFFS